VVAARLAASQGAQTTYSVSFQDAEYDESAAQRAISGHLGVRSITEEVSNAAIAEAFPQVVWQAETPLFRTAPAPLFLLSRRVHADGVKVVMTGEGADEMLLGYDLFREVEIRQFWSRQPDSLWRPSLLSRLYSYLPQYRNPRYFGMIKDFYRHTLDTGSRHFAMSVRWSNGNALEQYFSADMKAFAQGDDPVTELDRWLPASYGATSHVSRAQCIEIKTLLSNYLLSSQGDRMSMAHGVEGRYPYLDNEFVDFVTRLPRRIKLRGLKDKFVLRNAFKDTIPDTVRMRPKVAYQAPDIRAFFSAGRTPDYVSDLLAPSKIREAGFFDPDKVSFLFRKGLTYQLDRAGTRDNMAFTLILSTMLLYDIFVLGNRSMSPDIRIPSTLTLV
jgi:asparagine synthase (glutamine-hydrolysing)